MENGKYSYYVIQQRPVARSPWLKPKSPLQEVPEDARVDWTNCGEGWGKSTIPHVGTGNNWRPINKKAYDEWHDCYRKTDQHGWRTLEFALAALKRLVVDDAKGLYDVFSAYQERCQAVRHEFRIVQVSLVFERKTVPFSVSTELLKSI